MPAYWIAHVTVSDEAAYREYAVRATEVITARGGRFLARGGRHRQFEGNDRARNVLVQFPSFGAAEDCYLSADYQEIVSIAKGAGERDLVIVDAATP